MKKHTQAYAQHIKLNIKLKNKGKIKKGTSFYKDTQAIHRTREGEKMNHFPTHMFVTNGFRKAHRMNDDGHDDDK